MSSPRSRPAFGVHYKRITAVRRTGRTRTVRWPHLGQEAFSRCTGATAVWPDAAQPPQRVSERFAVIHQPQQINPVGLPRSPTFEPNPTLGTRQAALGATKQTGAFGS